MTRTLLVAGTASHVGKSTVVTGLCRHLSDRGLDVVPFKAQNMSNNARVALRPDGEWGEIGVSQHVQARAARVPPTTDMNPVLLKPRGDGESQIVIDGAAVGHYRAGEYYDEQWNRAREAAARAYDRLADAHDVIVAEGAGGLGEVNLHHRDLANVETARFADADVLLLADIERGGAFASLLGTIELVPADVRDRVVGAAITKFRGDESLLRGGIETIQERTGVPVLGVIPYADPGLPAEDSVDLPAVGERRVWGADDGVADERSVRIAVPRLPRISNFTDFEPLAAEPGVRVAFVPLDHSLDDAEAVVLPGTKNTVDDLRAAKDAGFDDALADFDGPVVGICGGYQMLGERLTDADVEGIGDDEVISGFGLLPIETRFSPDKRVERVAYPVGGCGPIDGAEGVLRGYEIHHGTTTATAQVERPIGPESACVGPVLGTYVHGLFEHRGVRDAFVETAYEFVGRIPPTPSTTPDRRAPRDRAADLVAESIDLDALALLPEQRSARSSSGPD